MLFPWQGREDAENVGYIIPSSVVHHFLSDIARNGNYTGFVTLGITWAPLENRHLRDYVGIDTCRLEPQDAPQPPQPLSRSGVMVCKVPSHPSRGGGRGEGEGKA
jgi:hypothetical protein